MIENNNNSRWAANADGIKKEEKERTANECELEREGRERLKNYNRTGNEHVACEWGTVDHMPIMDCN